MLEQILKQLEKGIINWYGAKILIEDLYKNNGVSGNVTNCYKCGEHIKPELFVKGEKNECGECHYK